MSTENKNKQTLFRFVSLRNPNLTETKKENLAFIHRPLDVTGVFDEASASDTKTRFQALLAKAGEFASSAYRSVGDIEKAGLDGLQKVGESINKGEDLSSSDLELCKSEYERLSNESIRILWDNLVYQFVTQKDFYLKEGLAQVIKALHIGYASTLDTKDEKLKKINGDDFVKRAFGAKIIIPIAISEKESSTTEEVILTEKDAGRLEVDFENLQRGKDALSEKENLEKLKSEIEAIKEKYWADYEKAYKTAKDAYDATNGAAIAAYIDQEDYIDELEESNASEEDIKAAYDQLDLLDYPEFTFKYKDELNWDDVYGQLSEESLEFFLDNFAIADEFIDGEVDLKRATVAVSEKGDLTVDTRTLSFKHNSYDDVISDINARAFSAESDILSETNLPQDEFINIGGAVVPVSTSPTPSTPHLSYILRAKRRGFFGPSRGYVTLQINVENTSWSVSSAIINATRSSGNVTENIGNIAVVDNKIVFPNFLRNKISDISSLSIQIFFSNGRSTTLQLSAITVNRYYTGMLRLVPVVTDQDPKEDTTNDGTESAVTLGKHFGLKRLGVAEYMKVVQSTHAYVPGEVSNIENVMASELRHKSINELTRTEETITTSETQEVEKVSDTTKVNRAEMQTEVAKVIDKQKSFNAHANFTRDTKIMKIDVGTAFASNNAQQTSNIQAVTKSKEITERAMERVQSKISEERINKIIQEVSLTNVHEYDNRGGIGENAERPQHITGVYRWVDKKMKNQIYNYGKRSMFEFMIPEPAKLHRLAVATTKAEHTFTAPVDPRTAPSPHTMKNATLATDQLLQYWADMYNVQLTAKPENKKQIIQVNGNPQSKHNWTYSSEPLQIEQDYVAKSGSVQWMFRKKEHRRGRNGRRRPFSGNFSNLKGGNFSFSGHRSERSKGGTNTVSGLNLSDTFTYTASGRNISSFDITLDLNCEPSASLKNAWKLENFNVIIEAYEAALQVHNDKVAEFEAEQDARAAEDAEKREALGNFYRIIEGDILKHNCVAYLLQNYLTTLGQDFTEGDKMQNFKVNLTEDLDKYTATAKFLEQAFEWSIMDYTFYPYFWADRKEWQEMYLTQNTDPLFRSFLQAGMARVIVTVKPGFEEAVQYFLETGRVWMGGETPVIGDPLYMSIVEEINEPTGEPQGKYWITTIPTSLTILQAKSAGLEVEQALPIFPEAEPENCENPEQLENTSAFKLDDAQLTSPSTSDTTLYSS
ncbi:hypothetical protein [Winogradskyella sp. 3972H.M.0a.05]|uniref:hypothetical protein n=1 Tax=Winogradskyella sp. 3972H.M.0a.05 TaxID=2950277 RepID=UPI00339B043E